LKKPYVPKKTLKNLGARIMCGSAIELFMFNAADYEAKIQKLSSVDWHDIL
jgi:hypothetical protein